MKHIRGIVCISICLLSLTLHAEKVGTLRYLMGKIMYKATASSAYTKAVINQPITMEGWLKIDLDSEAEILWNDNTTSLLAANQQTSIKALMTQVRKNSSWSNSLQKKINALSLQTKQPAVTVAGVRREEVDIKAESELYWAVDTLIPLDDAINLFQAEKYSEAVKQFLEIVEQAPLRKDAETARGYLILCYDKLGDKQNLTFQIQKIKSDFPNSTLIENLSEYKQ